MPYTGKNYSVKLMPMLYGLCFILLPLFSFAQNNNPQACPMYVYSEPVVESTDRSFGSSSQSAMVSNASWQSITNGTLSDDQLLYVDLQANQKSQLLSLDHFNIRIPEGATINGIQLVMEGESSQNESIRELVVNLKSGATTSINLANYATYGQEWQEGESQWIYGTKDYMWDINWTREMVMDPTFGLKLQLENKTNADVSASLDKISIRVFYTPLYTICDHDCVVFFVKEIPEATYYDWIIPQGFQRLSGDYDPSIINIGKTTALPGIYEMCVETVSNSGNSVPCCREFRVDDCRTSALGDFVWNDLNGNGIQDSEDQGIPGIIVTLFDENNEVVATTTTDQNGKYLFENLQKGYYFIRLGSIPMDYVPTLIGMTNGSMDSNAQAFGLETGTAVFYLDPGVLKDDYDFGFFKLSRISGLVWEDMNYDGSQSSNEPIIASVTVMLLDQSGQTIQTVWTDANGRYEFNDLVPGTYQVQVDRQLYFITQLNIGSDVNDNDFNLDGLSDPLVLTSGTDYQNLNAGFYRTATVGDYTWIDLDRDGRQDADDIPFIKAWIKIFDRNDQMVGEIDVDEAGHFLFEDLVPGEYYFMVDINNELIRPTLLNVGTEDFDSDATTLADGTFGSVPFTLVSGEANLDIDLGFEYIPSSIGGYAWIDDNGNGIKDSDEIAQVDAIVTLLDDNNNAIQSTSVKSDGSFLFDLLNPGIYQLSFSTVGDFLFTIKSAGADNADSDVNESGLSDLIALEANQDLLDISAGYLQYSIISDRVFLDINRNGIQDAVDTGIEGISLQLYNEIGVLVADTETDVNGLYDFGALLPGAYYIIVSADERFVVTEGNVGNDENIDSDLFITLDGEYRGSTLILTSGTILEDHDFGFQYDPSSIKGFVWEDLNANGVFENEDPRIEDIVVNLYNENNELVASTVTNGDGAYLFEILDPINYYIRYDFNSLQYPTFANAAAENIDSDITDANGNNTTDFINLGIGEHREDVTAGYFMKASVGNYVWLDENYNGIQDDTESGLAGITISLLDDADNVIASSITQSDGSYLFSGLRPNAYSIKLDFSSQLTITLTDVSNDDSVDSDVALDDGMVVIPDFVLTSGEQYLDLDFGFIEYSSISGLVWEDINYDGIRQSTEPVISGVEVMLRDANNNTMLTTITDANGRYIFENLLPQIYSCQVDIQDYEVTRLFVGAEDVNSNFDSQGFSHPIVITSGTDYQNLDAGLYKRASLGDYVWIDVNRNGVQDSGELPLAFIRLTLYDWDNLIVDETITDALGRYNFTLLNPGTYFISADINDQRYQLTIPNASSIDLDSDAVLLTDGSFGSSEVVLISDEDNRDLDLGFQYIPSSISGFTYQDSNGNGQRDTDETSQSDVIVSLLDGMGNVLSTQIVDAMGNYTFDTLNPGEYQVSFSTVGSSIFTSQNVGDDSLDSDVDATGSTDIISLTANANIANVSAGYIEYSSIGDYIFLDINRNGVQDNEDTGLSGVQLNLYDNSGFVVRTTETTQDGGYVFDNLLPGSYYIVAIPSTTDYIPTMANAGADDTLDSDLIDQGSGLYRGDIMLLSSGTVIENQDFGFVYIPSSISGFTFQDINGNGQRDADETSQLDVIVSLLDGMGNVQSTQSVDAMGNYTFDTLNPGEYQVSFSTVGSSIFTSQNVGDDSLDSDVDATGSTGIISLTANANIANVSAGYINFGSIGDFVFLDLNRNGIQDNTDLGLPLIKLDLYDQSGFVVSTVFSGEDGSYTFNNILAGEYYIVASTSIVDIIPTSANIGSDDSIDSDLQDNGNGLYTSDIVTITAGLNLFDQDFGFQYRPSSISGFVWEDVNADGVFEGADFVRRNIQVNLYNESGVQVASNTTDINGYYEFINLYPISYYVQFGMAAEDIITISNAAADNVDSDITGANGTGTTDLISLSIGEHRTNVTAGYYRYASVGDFAWLDADLNGVQGASELGIQGLNISLYDENNNIISSIITDDNGKYRFDNVVPGTYRVGIDYPVGFEATMANVGNNTTLDSDINTMSGMGITPSFDLRSRENNEDIDLGLVDFRAHITGVAFLDNNGNGLRENDEMLIPDIEFSLFDMTGTFIASAISDADGMYNFSQILPDSYYVSADIPIDFYTTQIDQGTNDNIDNDFFNDNGIIRTMQMDVFPMSTVDNYDLGIYQLVNIGDKVWIDSNANALFDGNELGQSGLTIELINSSGSLVATTMTDIRGNYLFENYPPGTYQIKSTIDGRFIFTEGLQGTDSAIDSDITIIANNTGFTEQTLISSGMDNLDLDIGLLLQNKASISGQVWLDINQDAMYSMGEELVKGVEVNLFNSNNMLIASTSTSDNGQYLFDDLLAGMYYVQFVDTTEAGFTIANAVNDMIDSDVDNTNGPGTTSLITINTNVAVSNVDAGILPLDEAVITGNVWNDFNANGIFETGEFPVKDVLVQLFSTSGSSLVSMMTTGTGMYMFNHLPAGDYYIQVSAPASFDFTISNVGMDDTIDSDITSANGLGTTDVISLTQNQVLNDIDAGLLNLMNGTITGLVWNDQNYDGIRDMIEPIRSAAELLLFDATGSQVASTLTNVNGGYTFSNLSVGDYYIAFADIMNEGATIADAGMDDMIDSDFNNANGANTTAIIMVGVNQTITNIDLGLIELANSSISGLAWNDANRDGIRQSTEILLSSITVRLFDMVGNVLASTMTASDGSYSFIGLDEGDYIVEFGSLTNFGFTTSNMGMNDALDSDVTNNNGSGTTDIITLAINTSITDIDAGYNMIATGGIMGTVWQDLSGDGLRDMDELLVPNVTVNLYSQGQVVATTTTDMNGKYTFTMLVPGLYNVEFGDPFGYGFTLSNAGMDDTLDSDITNVSAGIIENIFVLFNTMIANMDAGFASPNEGSISGQVWNDDNRNGLNDNGELGVANNTINLLNTSGSIISTTITDMNGNYSFDALIAGTYVVQVVTMGNVEFTDPNVGMNDTIDSDITEANGQGTTDNITITGTQTLDHVDAGIRELANGVVSGVVFDDLNADGLRDTDDPLWQGITISLFSENGTLVSTTVTDADGAYSFMNVIAGNYYISISVPSTSSITTPNVGMDDTIDSDITGGVTINSTDIFELMINESIANIDAGLYIPGVISGIFFFDNNEDGVIDPLDLLLSGKTVSLQDLMGTVVAQTTTDGMGAYMFNDIIPGDYIVAFPLESTEEITISNASPNELIDSDVIAIMGGQAVTGAITIISSDDIEGVNAGVKDVPQFISISGQAWEDINGDGVRASTDPVLPGYTVTLYDVGGMMISSVVTGTDGRYSFNNVASMQYYVVFTLPANQGFTLADATADDMDSDVTASQVAGSTDLVSTNINTLDAGFYRFASLGDRVWNDFNVNGILDNSEGGINTIRVRLFAADGTLLSTRFTNTNNATGEDGYYLFSGLRPGGYYVRVDPSNGMFFTEPNVGTDDTIDSDVNSVNGFGTTPIYTLSSGESNTTVDIGLLQDPADVGDRTWVDYDGDGIQDADEPGLNNVKVELFSIDNELIMTTFTATQATTLNDGYYAFTNVQPGAYYMVFTPPSGYLSTIADQGGNDANDSDVTSIITPGATNIVNLSSGENEKDIDAGFYEPAGLGNFVWEDLNKNGIQDQGEPGVANVAVALRRPNGNVIATTTTNNAGMYSFGGLTQGVYFVTFTAPNGYMFTTPDAGPDNIDSDANVTGNSPLVSLAHGVTFSDMDAGIYVASSLLGSYVWLDFNKDGIQTANEKGIENVQVNLLNMSGVIIESTITDFDGKYLFYNVNNTNYNLQFVAPEGMAFTIKNNGTDDNRDSDVDSNGMTDMITVNNNYNMHVDAGLYEVDGITETVNDDMVVSILSGTQNGEYNLLQWTTDQCDIISLERKYIHDEAYTMLSDSKLDANTFSDFNILRSGMYDYRLKLINSEGEICYSNIARVLVQEEMGYTVNVMPNPIRSHGQLLINATRESDMQWSISDESGRIVRRSSMRHQITTGEQLIDFQVDGLPTGTYIILIEFDQKRITKKIIVME